jgi:hypothetical protein
MSSLVASFVLNPFGAIQLALSPVRLEYFWLSLLPVGFLCFLGFRGAFFLIIPVALLLPAHSHNFWAVGINYGAPIVLPALVLAVMGAREILLLARRLNRSSLHAVRLGLGAFVLVTACLCSHLYGNVFGKTYKIAFGSAPFRQVNELDHIGELGIVTRLPPYGRRERLLWDLVEKIPD